jgi:uncharacterized protein (TIGR03086 family)
MSNSVVPLPTFIIIGAQKSGTRWLRTNLGKHRDIYTAPVETQFFHSPERFEILGLGWYRAQFADWAGERIVGEATPGYMMWRHRPRLVAERMKETVPRARLIALLRNPIDRALSAMVHFIRQEQLPPDARLLDLVQQTPPEDDPRCLISGGWYAASLKPYRELFGDQLLVLLHDDLADEPQRVYNRALMHIGAPLDFVPPDLGEVVFSNQRNGSDEHAEVSNGQLELSEEDRQRLYAYFRPDVEALQKMIRRDLSRWDPGGSYSVEFGIDPWSKRAGRHHGGRGVVESYEKASDWVEGLVRTVPEDQFASPTPCSNWNVRDLLNRIVRLPHLGVAILRRAVHSNLDDRDFIGHDVAADYRAAADEFLTVMKEPGSLAGTVASPFGEMAAGAWAQLVFVNQVTYGWDLATATGQDATIPAPLLEVADRLVRGPFSGIPRMPELFDVEIPVGESATPTERYVAFLGRDPGK